MPPGEKERQNHSRLKQSATGLTHRNSKHPGIPNMPLGNFSKRKHPEEADIECAWGSHSSDDLKVSSQNGNYFSSIQPVREEVLPVLHALRQDFSLSLDSLNENLIDLSSNCRHRSAGNLLHCPFVSSNPDSQPFISITDLREGVNERSSSRESLNDYGNFSDHDYYDEDIPLIVDSDSDESEVDSLHVSLIKLPDSCGVHPAVSSLSDIPFRKVVSVSTVSACNSYDSFPTTSSCESLRTATSSSTSSSVSDLFPNPESYEMLYKNFELAAKIESERNLQGNPPLFRMDSSHSTNGTAISWQSSARRKSAEISESGSFSSDDFDLGSEGGSGITTFARLADKRKRQTSERDDNPVLDTRSDENTHWSEFLSKQKDSSPKDVEATQSPDSTGSPNSDGTKPKRPQFLPIQLRHIQRPLSRPIKTPLLQDSCSCSPLSSSQNLMRTFSAPEGFLQLGIGNCAKNSTAFRNSTSIIPEIIRAAIPEVTHESSMFPSLEKDANSMYIDKEKSTSTNLESESKGLISFASASEIVAKDWEDLLGNGKWTSWNSAGHSRAHDDILKPLRLNQDLCDINANFSSDDSNANISEKLNVINLTPKATTEKTSPSHLAKWLEDDPLSKATTVSSNVLDDNELSPIPNHIIPRLPSDDFSDTCSLSSLESLEMDDSVIWESLYSFPSDDSFLSAPYHQAEIEDEFDDSLVENINYSKEPELQSRNEKNALLKNSHCDHASVTARHTTATDRLEASSWTGDFFHQPTFQTRYDTRKYQEFSNFHLSPYLCEEKADVTERDSSVHFSTNCKWENSNINNSCERDAGPSIRKTYSLSRPRFPVYKLTNMIAGPSVNTVCMDNVAKDAHVQYANHKPLKPIHVVDAEHRCRKAIEQFKKSTQPSSAPAVLSRAPPAFPAQTKITASTDVPRPRTLQLRDKPPGKDDSRHWGMATGWEEDIMDALPPQEMKVSPRHEEEERLAKLFEEKKALVSAVESAVDLILNHFSKTKTRQPQEKFNLGDSKLTPDIGHLILHYVCPAIEAIFSDGLRQFTHSWLVGRVKNSVWTVIDATTELGPGTRCLNELVTAIKSQSYLRGNSLKANAFFLGLLNNNLLEVWFQHVHDHPNITKKYYEASAFLYLCNMEPFQGLFSNLIVAMQPLNLLPFRLDYAFEYKMLQNEATNQADSHDLVNSYPSTSMILSENAGPMSILIGQKKDALTASKDDSQGLSSSVWNFVGKVKSYKKSWASGQSQEKNKQLSESQSSSLYYGGNIPSPAVREIHPLARKEVYPRIDNGSGFHNTSGAKESEGESDLSGSQGWTMKWIRDFAGTVPEPMDGPDGRSSSGEEDSYSFRARERLSSVFKSQRWQKLGTGISQILPKMTRRELASTSETSSHTPPIYDRHLSGCSEKEEPWEERSSTETNYRACDTLLGSPVKTLCHFVSSDEGELSFTKGDILTINHQVDSEWLHCSYGKESGLVHKDYVQQLN